MLLYRPHRRVRKTTSPAKKKTPAKPSFDACSSIKKYKARRARSWSARGVAGRDVFLRGTPRSKRQRQSGLPPLAPGPALLARRGLPGRPREEEQGEAVARRRARSTASRSPRPHQRASSTCSASNDAGSRSKISSKGNHDALRPRHHVPRPARDDAPPNDAASIPATTSTRPSTWSSARK